MLRVCEGCDRHVHEGSRCPWCGADAKIAVAPSAASARLGRAALMAFGAASAVAVAVACNEAKSPNEVTVEPVEAGPAPSTTASAKATPTATVSPTATVDPNCCMPYGAPPTDDPIYV